MSHKKNLEGLDIELFTNISVEIIDNMVKNLKIHRLTLDFDSLFLGLILEFKKMMKLKSSAYNL